MTKTAIVFVALLLAACAKTPEETTPSSNPEIKVERLFVHEGCAVYRFEDVGSKRYYVRCPAVETQSIQHHESCGKNCIRKIDTVTLGVER